MMKWKDIYIVPFTNNYKQEGSSIQYKSYENILPLDVIKIKFRDFKQYFSINGGFKKS